MQLFSRTIWLISAIAMMYGKYATGDESSDESSLQKNWGYLEYQTFSHSNLPALTARSLHDVAWFDLDLNLRRGDEETFKTCKPGMTAEAYITSLVCFWSTVFKDHDCKTHGAIDPAYQQKSVHSREELHLFCVAKDDFSEDNCKLFPRYPMLWTVFNDGRWMLFENSHISDQHDPDQQMSLPGELGIDCDQTAGSSTPCT